MDFHLTEYFSFLANIKLFKTSYGSLGKGQSLILKPAPHPTVIKDLPFNGSTFYRDNYTKHPLG